MEEVINFLESHQGSGVFSRPHIDFSSNFSRNLEFHLNKREKMDVVQLLQRQFIDYMKSLFMELVSKLTKHIVRTYQVCNVEFKYTDELNPKRFLTSPSDAVFNDGHDNSQTQQSYLMESLVYKASAYIMQTPPDNCVPIATANAYKIARPCYLWLIMLEFEPFPSPLSFYLSGVALLYFWCFKNAGNRPAVVNRVPYASLLPQRDRSMVQGQDTYSSGDLFLLSLASF
ncbi:uncharacterized protein LOC104905818 isoform X3 [Beta vulgaris subsp. vulgaris]|uniref:uncharacterized protein LOC104905818 isoform X3 n=1 Tax=Beta vulgaris subsp. vulgaris TaxID=3555 RepID=UPI0025468DE6|nr:uncharacterized protein LOC104905818 isoform X3 [Beta vulgaris subsp. vulgaris]